MKKIFTGLFCFFAVLGGGLLTVSAQINTIKTIYVKPIEIKTALKDQTVYGIARLQSDPKVIGSIRWEITDEYGASIWNEHIRWDDSFVTRNTGEHPKIEIPFSYDFAIRNSAGPFNIRLYVNNTKETLMAQGHKKITIPVDTRQIKISNLKGQKKGDDFEGFFVVFQENAVSEDSFSFQPQIKIYEYEVGGKIFHEETGPVQTITGKQKKQIEFTTKLPTDPKLYILEVQITDINGNPLTGTLEEPFLIEGQFAHLKYFHQDMSAPLEKGDVQHIKIGGIVRNPRIPLDIKVIAEQWYDGDKIKTHTRTHTIKNFHFDEFEAEFDIPIVFPGASQMKVAIELSHEDSILEANFYATEDFGELEGDFYTSPFERVGSKVLMLTLPFIVALAFLLAWIMIKKKRSSHLLLGLVFGLRMLFGGNVEAESSGIIWNTPLENEIINPAAVEDSGFEDFRSILFSGQVKNLDGKGALIDNTQMLICIFKDSFDPDTQCEAIALKDRTSTFYTGKDDQTTVEKSAIYKDSNDEQWYLVKYDMLYDYFVARIGTHMPIDTILNELKAYQGEWNIIIGFYGLQGRFITNNGEIKCDTDGICKDENDQYITDAQGVPIPQTFFSDFECDNSTCTADRHILIDIEAPELTFTFDKSPDTINPDLQTKDYFTNIGESGNLFINGEPNSRTAGVQTTIICDDVTTDSNGNAIKTAGCYNPGPTNVGEDLPEFSDSTQSDYYGKHYFYEYGVHGNFCTNDGNPDTLKDNFCDDNPRGFEICDKVGNCTAFDESGNEITIDFYDPKAPSLDQFILEREDVSYEVYNSDGSASGQGEADEKFKMTVNATDSQTYSNPLHTHPCDKHSEDNPNQIVLAYDDNGDPEKCVTTTLPCKKFYTTSAGFTSSIGYYDTQADNPTEVCYVPDGSGDDGGGEEDDPDDPDDPDNDCCHYVAPFCLPIYPVDEVPERCLGGGGGEATGKCANGDQINTKNAHLCTETDETNITGEDNVDYSLNENCSANNDSDDDKCEYVCNEDYTLDTNGTECLYTGSGDTGECNDATKPTGDGYIFSTGVPTSGTEDWTYKNTLSFLDTNTCKYTCDTANGYTWNASDEKCELTTIGSGACGNLTQTYGAIDYDTVEIGDQCWTKPNLQEILPKEYQTTTGEVIDSACEINSNALGDSCNTQKGSHTTTTESLYTWEAATVGEDITNPMSTIKRYTVDEVQGLCGRLSPGEWYLPTDEDWHILEDYLTTPGNTCNESRAGWDCADAGTTLKKGSTSGFDAVMVGYDSNLTSQAMINVGTHTAWWSNTRVETGPLMRELTSSQGGFIVGGTGSTDTVHRNVKDPNYHLSLRCLLKDSDTDFDNANCDTFTKGSTGYITYEGFPTVTDQTWIYDPSKFYYNSNQIKDDVITGCVYKCDDANGYAWNNATNKCEIPASCTGDIPDHSVTCGDDDAIWFGADIANALVQECTHDQDCEYTCDEDAQYFYTPDGCEYCDVTSGYTWNSTTYECQGGCTGDDPENATLCTDDDQNVTGLIAKTVVDTCTTQDKCEFTCDNGYKYDKTREQCQYIPQCPGTTTSSLSAPQELPANFEPSGDIIGSGYKFDDYIFSYKYSGYSGFRPSPPSTGYCIDIQKNNLVIDCKDTDILDASVPNPENYYDAHHTFEGDGDTFDGTANGYAILIEDIDGFTIQNCNINNNFAGILIKNSTNGTIKNNRFSMNAFGIALESSSDISISSNTFASNNNAVTGVDVQEITISNNTINTDNSNATTLNGIRLIERLNGNDENKSNTISNNTISNLDGKDINITGDKNDISENTLSSIDASGQDISEIYIKGDQNDIIDNTAGDISADGTGNTIK